MTILFLFFVLIFNTQEGSTGSTTSCNLQLPTLVSDWSVQSERLPITISAGPVALNNIGIASTFVEGSTRRSLPGEVLVLCSEAKGDCNSSISVPAQTTKTVYMDYQGPIYPGVYSGHVIPRADGCASPTKSQLNLYVSSDGHHMLGILTVIAGGILAWWVKIYAAQRVTRNQALLPIALLTERLTALNALLDSANIQLGSKTPTLSQAIDDWVKQFDIAALEIKYDLPRKRPSPFATGAPISNDYTSFVSRADSSINLFTVFVKEGVHQVARLTSAGEIPSPQAAKTITAIDNLYSHGLTEETARTNIRQLIAAARAAGPSPSPESSTAAPVISRDRLLTEIRRLNTVAWIVMLAMAAVGTIITLVLKPGFGKPVDYLICLATSFGIPILGSLVIPSQTTVAAITNPSHAVTGSKGSAG